MSKLNKFKLWLDFVMIVVLLLMYNTKVISLTFHEIGGLALLGILLIHVLLNYKWVGAVTKNLFKKSTSAKARIGYLVNVLLLVAFLTVGISGIFISKVVFHITLQTSLNWKAIHISAAAFALILIGIHIGLHYRFILDMCKKIIPVPKKLARVFSILFLAASIGYGSYSFVSNEYLQLLTMPFSSQSTFGDRGNMERPDFPDGQGRPGEMPSKEDSGSQSGGTTTAYKTTSDTETSKDTGNDTGKSAGSDQSGRGQMPQNGNFKGGDFKNGHGNFPGERGNAATGGVFGILKVVVDYFSIAMLFTSLTILLQVICAGVKKKTVETVAEAESETTEDVSNEEIQ